MKETLTKIKTITTPLDRDTARTLRCGDEVLLTGEIYTARDAAHMRLMELSKNGERFPLPMEGAIIYYVGPTPEKPGTVIGSAGPTTSYRMDSTAPSLIAKGLMGMIGKGKRSAEVVEAMKAHGAVYLGAIGGAGALIARCIESSEVIAYEDLSAEAVRKLFVRDMPLTVIIDSLGNNLYDHGREDYLSFNKQQSEQR
ncbi:MAG: Fe-S-containing hydro-lyase [Oscillospiraceae bacterium]|nr:Fe-S-containing hydro-lyase [Oscillospiraceae bacterium]